MKLIKTFAPLPDESGLGYYRRLSSENALSGWRELARLAEVSVTKGALLARPEHVARTIGLEVAWCEQAHSQDEVSRGWRGQRRAGADAVCPGCLSESPHQRLSWEHAYVVACPHHEVLLCDKCNACGTRLTSSRERIEFCECGHDLRQTVSARATDAQLWLAALIESSGVSSKGQVPLVANVNIDLLAMLTRTLCSLSDPLAPPQKQNLANPRTIQEAQEFLRPMDSLLADWPKAFEAHVSARIAVGTPEARTLNTLLGKWYQQLRSLSECVPLQPFLEAVGRVAAVEFNGLISLDGAAEATTKDYTHILLAHAAKRVGVHRDTLATYLKAGQVTYRTKKFGTRGLAYEVPVNEVTAIVTARKGWVVEKAACTLFGVPPSVLDRMVEAELVVSDPNWRRELRKGGPVELASCERLVSILRGYRLSTAPVEGRRISLCELTSRRAGDKKAIVAALQAIASGKIRPLTKAESIGGFQFLLAEVSKHFSTPVLEAGLSVQALATSTGWKWESVSNWIDAGLLKSNSIMLRGQPCRVILPGQLLEFCRTYMPLADLARELGSKSSALADRLEGIEVIGSKPLPNGQRRGGLIRVGDLARFALSKRVVEPTVKPPAGLTPT